MLSVWSPPRAVGASKPPRVRPATRSGGKGKIIRMVPSNLMMEPRAQRGTATVRDRLGRHAGYSSQAATAMERRFCFSPLQLKPKAPTGCKLVGAVRGAQRYGRVIVYLQSLGAPRPFG